MQSKMTTLGKVFDTVDQMSVNNHDKFINVREISFESLESIKISGESHYLRPVAQQKFANRLGIPISYLEKCPTHVQAYNLNHWIEKERNSELFFRFDGQEVRAIFTPRYRPVDNFEVLEKLDRLGFVPDTEVQVSLDQEFMQLSIPDSGKTFSLNGDKITPGVSIVNSEVGISSLSLSAFFVRLVCTNGLVSKEQIGASFRHISLKILTEFPNVLNRLSSELESQRSKFRISLESRVDNPLSTLDNFNRQFLLSQEEKIAVGWAWPMEHGETMFNIVNTYTRASQFDKLPAQSSYKLQTVGGSILSLVK